MVLLNMVDEDDEDDEDNFPPPPLTKVGSGEVMPPMGTWGGPSFCLHITTKTSKTSCLVTVPF